MVLILKPIHITKPVNKNMLYFYSMSWNLCIFCLQRYGPVISTIPQQLSRFQFKMITNWTEIWSLHADKLRLSFVIFVTRTKIYHCIDWLENWVLKWVSDRVAVLGHGLSVFIHCTMGWCRLWTINPRWNQVINS